MKETKYYCDRCGSALTEAGDWLKQSWECKIEDMDFELCITSDQLPSRNGK